MLPTARQKVPEIAMSFIFRRLVNVLTLFFACNSTEHLLKIDKNYFIYQRAFYQGRQRKLLRLNYYQS